MINIKCQKVKVIYFILLFTMNCNAQNADRLVKSLNGEWSITKTNGTFPQSYTSKVMIPGLVDMAFPSIDVKGSFYKDGWYWYKSNFTLSDASFDIIQLKIFKAKYHTKVYLNGNFVGENYNNFTPSYYNLKSYIEPSGTSNEIIIGVGNMYELPDTIANGFDIEKIRYIPGLYDNIEITMSNKPFISNIQTVPNSIIKKLRVIAKIETNDNLSFPLDYRIVELVSGFEFSKGTITISAPKAGLNTVDFLVDMSGSTLWSPELPFMYKLILQTTNDKKETRFGLRSFRFDSDLKIALLNEKTYYLRGTNVNIYRFFEDESRKNLPWDDKWVIKLHQQFKNLHLNSMRYCIGFPPERWYEVADSIGLLIQDEYPYWNVNGSNNNVKSTNLASEYTKWMQERWNHPSVVIWDAQNESVTAETGKAIQLCRDLDYSDRPWENGWSEPQSKTDPIESHPYLFNDPKTFSNPPIDGYLKSFLGIIRRPCNDANDRSVTAVNRGVDLNVAPLTFENPTIINEYGWLWLNRDGSTTTLTDFIYESLWGKNLMVEERRTIYAKHLGMLTEYWRGHRRAAGVMHFCGLGYSRPTIPRGQTSDNWIDVQNLIFEPQFYKYVRSAFSPVGLMIDKWEKDYNAQSSTDIFVNVINDLEESYDGTILLTLSKDGQNYTSTSSIVHVSSYGISRIRFRFTFPSDPGRYEMVAEMNVNGDIVRSQREINLIPSPSAAESVMMVNKFQLK